MSIVRSRSLQVFFIAMAALFLTPDGMSLSDETGVPAGEDFHGVSYQDGLLKVSVEGEDFEELLNEISELTGVKIDAPDQTPEEGITVDFDYLPLEQGLQRLLSGRNYIFFYRSEKTQGTAALKRVLVMPESGGIARSEPDEASADVTSHDGQPEQAEDGKTIQEVFEEKLEAASSKDDKIDEFSKTLQETFLELSGGEGPDESGDTGGDSPPDDDTKSQDVYQSLEKIKGFEDVFRMEMQDPVPSDGQESR